MIVDLRPITDIPKRLELILDKGWWEDAGVEGDIPLLEGPLCAEVTISRAGSKFVLEGRFSGCLRMTCDRCLENYLLEMRHGFRLFLTRPAPSKLGEEQELEPEDLEEHFVSSDEIDLAETIREQVFLNLPMKALCREDCSGLCPHCGANLNQGGCNCAGSYKGGGFSKLKKLMEK